MTWDRKPSQQSQRDTVRMLRSDGATYNVYGKHDGLNRTWQLDPVPLLLSSSEWAGPEAGLKQRAERPNLILQDLYGPRSLIRKGMIPPDLVYADPSFQRPCVVPPPGNPPGLTLYAADLVRSTDGHFRILKDRTQAPSGMGYALENRTVMSRLIPSLFRDSHPHRLAPFFRRMRESLAALAPRRARRTAGGDHDTRAPQRNLFRAHLPRQLPRLHPARGIQPHRPC